MKKYLILLILSLLICCNLVGCNQFDKTPTEYMEPEPISSNNIDELKESKGGYAESNDAIIQLFTGYSEISNEIITNCFYEHSTQTRTNIENCFKDAESLKDSVKYFIDDIIIYNIDMEPNTLNSLGYNNVSAVKSNKVILPLNKDIDGETFRVKDKYDIYTIQINEKWYIANIIKTSEEIVEQLTHNKPLVTSIPSSLEKPVYVGDWTDAWVMNDVSGNYEKIAVRVSEVLTAENAQEFIDTYNSDDYDVQFDKLDKKLEYVIYKYEVYFPADFTVTEESGITKPMLSFIITNMKDDGKNIANYKGLGETWDISNIPTDSIKPGTIWSDGIGVYAMAKDFKDYLIKIPAPEIECPADEVTEESTSTEYVNSYITVHDKPEENTINE